MAASKKPADSSSASKAAAAAEAGPAAEAEKADPEEADGSERKDGMSGKVPASDVTVVPGEKPADRSKLNELYILAALGDPDALISLGSMCHNGFGPIKQNKRRAFEYYRNAASLGSAKALSRLGVCALAGEGCEPDLDRAFVWLREAAELGDALAMNNLGCMYGRGDGVEKDESKAFEWHMRSAQAGEPMSYSNLAALYFQGLGVEKDEKEAFKWYMKAAEANDAEGMYIVGFAFKEGNMGAPKDVAEAKRWFTKGAEGGHRGAMTSLGFLYLNGAGDVIAKDDKEAALWFARAGSRGYPPAIYQLGILHEFGKGVPQSFVKAAELYIAAAQMGHPNAMERLMVLREKAAALKDAVERQRREQIEGGIGDGFSGVAAAAGSAPVRASAASLAAAGRPRPSEGS